MNLLVYNIFLQVSKQHQGKAVASTVLIAIFTLFSTEDHSLAKKEMADGSGVTKVCVDNLLIYVNSLFLGGLLHVRPL